MKTLLFPVMLAALALMLPGAAMAADDVNVSADADMQSAAVSDLETQAGTGESQTTLTESQTEGTPHVGLVRGNLSGDAGAGTDEPDKPSAGATM